MTLSRTGDKVYMCSVYDLTEQVGHSLTGKHPTGVFSDSVRSRTGDKVRNHPARRRYKVFAGLFQKAAGSQGRALSRIPQDAKYPL